MMSQVQSAIRYITSLPRVPGKEPWSISPQDCLDLAWMMDAVAQGRRDLRIAEIGTFRGQSAVLLACWAGEGHGMVTTADVQTHPGTDAIIQGAKWARDRIARVVAHRPTRILSLMSRGQYDAAFVDGAHSPGAVRLDAVWARKYARAVIFHDYVPTERPELVSVVDEVCQGSRTFIHRGRLALAVFQ